MDLPLWARKFSEGLVRGSCNLFAVTADKWPCVVLGHAFLSHCVSVYIYVCLCVCVCVSNMDLPLRARWFSEGLECGSCNHFAVIAG
jgi:hypothetical protein